MWIESVVPLKVKPGRQRLEKRLLCTSHATGNVLFQRYTASWLSTGNGIQRSELRSRFSMESGLFFCLTVLLATRTPWVKENQPVFCQSEEQAWLHRVCMGILNSLWLVYLLLILASLIAQLAENLPAMQETPVPFLSWEDPLEKG